jgi:DNA-binding transcriptional regulator PaaX
MQPQVRLWNGDWTMLVVTSIGTDARTRAALRSSLQANRFAELREGVWLRPDNLAVDLPDDVVARVQVLYARDDAPAQLAARLWDLPAWSSTGHQLLDEMATATNTPARFAAAAAILRHLLTDPVLPEALLPDDWLGATRPNQWRLSNGLVKDEGDIFVGELSAKFTSPFSKDCHDHPILWGSRGFPAVFHTIGGAGEDEVVVI